MYCCRSLCVMQIIMCDVHHYGCKANLPEKLTCLSFTTCRCADHGWSQLLQSRCHARGKGSQHNVDTKPHCCFLGKIKCLSSWKGRVCMQLSNNNNCSAIYLNHGPAMDECSQNRYEHYDLVTTGVQGYQCPTPTKDFVRCEMAWHRTPLIRSELRCVLKPWSYWKELWNHQPHQHSPYPRREEAITGAVAFSTRLCHGVMVCMFMFTATVQYPWTFCHDEAKRLARAV